MNDIVPIMKALADESRLRALAALRGGELCACQLIELLGLAPATVSKHMGILRHAGLVGSRKAGRWVYYRLPERPSPHVKAALKWLLAAAGECAVVVEDSERLRDICGAGKEERCRAKAGK